MTHTNAPWIGGQKYTLIIVDWHCNQKIRTEGGVGSSLRHGMPVEELHNLPFVLP